MGKVKLYREDSTEVEVPDEAELKELSDKAAKATELQSQVDKLTGDINELKDFTGTPAELRDRNKALKQQRDDAVRRLEALEKTGKTIDASGAVVDHKPSVTMDDVTKAANQAAHQTMIEAEKRRIFAKIPEDKRELVQKKYDKLTAGEEVTVDNLESFVEEAFNAAGLRVTVDPLRRAMNATGGAPLLEKKKEENYADSAEGQNDAAAMGLSHALAPKK